MAVQSNIYAVGSTRTYHSTKPIATKSHMAVWVQYNNESGESVWTEVSSNDYDLIKNSAVINADYDITGFTYLEVRVADAPEELGTSPAAIGIIAVNIESVIIVADNITSVVIVAENIDEVIACATEPLKSAIVECGTEPLRQAILNAESNAIGSEAARAASELARDESELARDFSSEWASNPINDDIDDGINPVNLSSFHWAQVSKLYAEGLKIQGVWNPNDGVAPVPNGGIPEEDGMYWIVTEDAISPVYAQDWKEFDKIVYLSMLTPDPYLRLSNIVHWDNVVGAPQNIPEQIEFAVTAALETHYDILSTVDAIRVDVNGVSLSTSDFTSDAPVDGISAGFTLNFTPAQGDIVHATSVYNLVPPSSGVESLWDAQAEVLTANSYAIEPEDVFVKIWSSNGDGTFSSVDTTDYSSLHWSTKGDEQLALVTAEGSTQVALVTTEGNTQVARVTTEGDAQVARVTTAGDSAELEAWEAEAEANTAESTANAPLDTFTTIFTSNGDGTFTETASTWYSAFHWSEKAKFVASGLNYVGNWDASGGTFPPDGSATGDFYIVSVTGTISGTVYSVGDWLVWDNDSSTYNGIHWRFSWTIASDVTVEGALPAVGDDLARKSTVDTKLPLAGGIITGVVNIYDGTVASPKFTFMNDLGKNWAISTHGERANLEFYKVDGGGAWLSTEVTFQDDGNVGVEAPAPALPTHLTRKDYVDTQVATNTGRALSWDALGISDADFQGLDVVGALQYLAPKIATGQEVERVTHTGITPNFLSIFPEGANQITKLMKESNKFIFSYTSINAINDGVQSSRILKDWDTGLVDSGVITEINDQGGQTINGNLEVGTLNGYKIGGSSSSYDTIFIPTVVNSGVMEIGTHIDFHTEGSSVDYDARLTTSNDGNVSVSGSAPTDPAHLTRKDYVDGEYLFEENGYQKLPSGLIMQWGSYSTSAPTITFPIPFTSKCVHISVQNHDGDPTAGHTVVISVSNTQFTLETSGGTPHAPYTWSAIGY